MDPTFELEKAEPAREVRPGSGGATRRAMARAQEVQAKRAAHHKNRMVKHRENDAAGARAKIAEHGSSRRAAAPSRPGTSGMTKSRSAFCAGGGSVFRGSVIGGAVQRTSAP